MKKKVSDRYNKFMLICIIIVAFFNIIIAKNCPPLSELNYKTYMIIWVALFIFGFIIQTVIATKILDRDDEE